MVAMFVSGLTLELNVQSLQRTFQGWFLPSVDSFGKAVLKETIFFRNQQMRNKNCLQWPCLLTNQYKMCNLYRGPSIDASFQVSVHLAKRFKKRRIFRNQQIRNKNCLWWPLLAHPEEMCNIYRGPLIDASYQVSVHLDRRFQRKRVFRNQPIRKYNCLWLPCLLTDRDKCAFF